MRSTLRSTPNLPTGQRPRRGVPFQPVGGADLRAPLYAGGNLALEDIGQRLSMSKGNVSINIRQLEAWGGASSSVVGSRKDYYEANRDIKAIAIRRCARNRQTAGPAGRLRERPGRGLRRDRPKEKSKNFKRC